MAGMHSRSKLAEFKSELESGGDAVRELVRSTLQEILEEKMTEARTAGRIRRRGKRLQANRRHPIQTGRASLVEGRSQRPARHQMLYQEQPLARLPRMEGV